MSKYSELPGTGGDVKPRADGTDEDVEGHRAKSNQLSPDEPTGEGARSRTNNLDGDEDDVEGHLFRLGPTTEGEFAKRGPGENPHGDR